MVFGLPSNLKALNWVQGLSWHGFQLGATPAFLRLAWFVEHVPRGYMRVGQHMH